MMNTTIYLIIAFTATLIALASLLVATAFRSIARKAIAQAKEQSSHWQDHHLDCVTRAAVREGALQARIRDLESALKVINEGGAESASSAVTDVPLDKIRLVRLHSAKAFDALYDLGAYIDHNYPQLYPRPEQNNEGVA